MLNNKRILKFVKWHKLFTGEQGESSEPPRKKFQQPPPSVVLMEFSSKEPELMGMGMGVDLAMGNQLPDYTARTAIQSQIETAVKTVDTCKNPDAKSGESKPEDEEEIQACSGIALKRIKEVENRLHGKFAKVNTLFCIMEHCQFLSTSLLCENPEPNTIFSQHCEMK